MAKIEINWLEQWVMCIIGPLGHQSCELLLLQTWNYNNDLNLPSKWWVLWSTIMADVLGDLGGGTCYVANIQWSGGLSSVVSCKKPDEASMHIKHKKQARKAAVQCDRMSGTCCTFGSVLPHPFIPPPPLLAPSHPSPCLNCWPDLTICCGSNGAGDIRSILQG